jgi:hypothetical protein
MKQKKKHNYKRQNTINMKKKRTASTTTATYKPMIPGSHDNQKNNYLIQTDIKKNNRITDMSMGFEDKKNLKTKTTNRIEDKSSSPTEAITTTTSSKLAPSSESEVFDSSSDNAVSEMKKATDMRPDETSKVFSQLETKQQLDPSTLTANDIVKKTETNNSTDVNPAKINPTLQDRNHEELESKEKDLVSMQDAKPEVTQVHKESEKQEQLGQTIRFNDDLDKEHISNSLYNDENNNNPFISGLKLWQSYNEMWFKAYSEYMKKWSIF